MFNMPNRLSIPHHDCVRHATLHKLESQCNVRDSMASIGKMYPERNNLPQSVRDAIRYNESTTY